MGNERQKHGFLFEKTMEEIIAVLETDDNYTAEDDGNIVLSEELELRTSIKTQKSGGELCLGSFNRIASNDEPLLLIIGEWFDKNHIDSVFLCYLPNGFVPLFGNNAYDMIALCDEFVEYMHTTPDFHEHSYDSEWKERYQQFQDDYGSMANNCYIYPRAKRDHKKQARLQCAISYDDTQILLSNFMFLSYNIGEMVVHELNGYVKYDDFEEFKEAASEALVRLLSQQW